MGLSRTMSCADCDLRSERYSDTRENDCEMRASRAAIAPVACTMLVGCTNTGRPCSFAIPNRDSGLKLMSTERDWLMLYAYVASTVVLKRASRMLPVQEKFGRMDCCGR